MTKQIETIGIGKSDNYHYPYKSADKVDLATLNYNIPLYRQQKRALASDLRRETALGKGLSYEVARISAGMNPSLQARLRASRKEELKERNSFEAQVVVPSSTTPTEVCKSPEARQATTAKEPKYSLSLLKPFWKRHRTITTLAVVTGVLVACTGNDSESPADPSQPQDKDPMALSTPQPDEPVQGVATATRPKNAREATAVYPTSSVAGTLEPLGTTTQESANSDTLSADATATAEVNHDGIGGEQGLSVDEAQWVDAASRLVGPGTQMSALRAETDSTLYLAEEDLQGNITKIRMDSPYLGLDLTQEERLENVGDYMLTLNLNDANAARKLIGLEELAISLDIRSAEEQVALSADGSVTDRVVKADLDDDEVSVQWVPQEVLEVAPSAIDINEDGSAVDALSEVVAIGFDGEVRVAPEIGDTYHDKELGKDLYFNGSEYLDQYDYVVDRIRNGEETVVCAPCLYGYLEPDQSKGQEYLMQLLHGLSKWEPNRVVFEEAEIDTSSLETFTASLQENALPEGLVGSSRAWMPSLYEMNADIPEGISLDKFILEVYSPDQVGPLKYEDGPLKLEPRSNIVNYDSGANLQLGIGSFQIDNIEYLRVVLILFGEENSIAVNTKRVLSTADPNQITLTSNFINNSLYHFTTLPEWAQYNENHPRMMHREGAYIMNFWTFGSTKFNDPDEFVGAGIGESLSPYNKAVQILKPLEG